MDVPSSHTNRDYTLTSAFVWLLFDYLLTLDQEVELFWGQRLTAASLLFFSNRYLPLLCAAWWTPWWRHLQSFEEFISGSSCVVQLVLGGIGEYLLFVPVAAFSAMRAYALASSGKRAWGILVFLASVSPGIMALVLAPWLHFIPHPDEGCQVVYEAPVLLIGITRFLLVLADLVVLCITWSATYRHRQKSGHPRISDILFRDGTIYFVAQLLLNTVYLISILVPPEIFDAQDLNSMASLYVLPATAILVTRFLLDLQQASRRAMHLPAMNTENWEKVMGSLVLVSLERPGGEEDEGEEDCRCSRAGS